MKNIGRKLLAVGVGLLGVAGCYDLSVENTEGVGREEVLTSARDTEIFIAGVFVPMWAAMGNGYPWLGLSAMADQLETSRINYGVFEVAREPRQEFFNHPSYVRYALIDLPWRLFYETNSNAIDGLNTINNGLKIIDPGTGVDNTARAWSFAKMIQGTIHTYLGALYDQAAIVSDTIDLKEIPVLPLHPYQEVVDSGVMYLEDALEVINTTSFTIPTERALWVYGVRSSSAELAQFIHSQIARALAYSARNWDERQAVDWERVIAHVDQGLVSNFGPIGRPNTILNMGYAIGANAHPSTGFAGNNTDLPGSARVDLKIVGPADTTAAYRTWMKRVYGFGGVILPGADSIHPPAVNTPDRRIEPPGTPDPLLKTVPWIIRYTPLDPPNSANGMLLADGKRYMSNYWFNGKAPFGNTLTRLIERQDVIITPEELQLLKAEGLIHLNRLQEAVDIINRTRTEPVGGLENLPPIELSGDGYKLLIAPADSARCVPQRLKVVSVIDASAPGGRRESGECGDLWDAMMYEKRLVTFGYDALVAYGDMRGWGCLAPGTMLHFPVPAFELDLINHPSYTFGGNPDAAGSAPIPDPQGRCHMFFHFGS
jgi:hypothetical protein